VIVWGKNLDATIQAVCRYCKTALKDGGNCCIECHRDLSDLAVERDREWWSE
jgi:predicted amidophosphoribosyltransferase